MERTYTLKDLQELSPDLLNELFTIISTLRPSIEDRQSQHRAIWAAKEHCCPHCGSTNIGKNGRTKGGAQKFFCKDCKKYFCMSTNTVGYGSHFNIEKWTKFIECELNGFSHRKTADIVGIHRNTALLWRHKFYDALSYLQFSELKGEIQLDAKNIPINFKGMKASNMPRTPKKHASKSNKSKNRHTSCIISALDEEDHLVLRIEGFGKEDTEMYKTLSNQIQKDSHLIGDGFQGLKTIADELACSLSIVKADTHISDDGYNINGINQIHSELETFLRKYHGISTRHLQGYLNFFVLLKKLRYSYEYIYQTREAWRTGVPYFTGIKRRNESKQPYPFDIDEAYRDYNESQFFNCQSIGVA